jgi:hypothetical protein
MNDMTNSARRSAGARMLWTIGLASRTTPALIWESAALEQRRFTFSDIARLTDKFGNMLRGHGIEKGDRVIIMFPRIPEWAIAMVGALKIGAIPIPLTACAMLTPRRRSAARPRSKAGTSILFGPWSWGACSLSSACSSMPNPRRFEIGKVHQAGALKTIECRRTFSGWNSYNATRSGGKAVAPGQPSTNPMRQDIMELPGPIAVNVRRATGG